MRNYPTMHCAQPATTFSCVEYLIRMKCKIGLENKNNCIYNRKPFTESDMIMWLWVYSILTHYWQRIHSQLVFQSDEADVWLMGLGECNERAAKAHEPCSSSLCPSVVMMIRSCPDALARFLHHFHVIASFCFKKSEVLQRDWRQIWSSSVSSETSSRSLTIWPSRSLFHM